MPESLIGLGFVVLFCSIALAVNADAWVLIRAGLALAAIGFAYGIPTAIVYHWRLHRSLTRCGRLPPRWWIQPTAHHHLVPREDRAGVLRWGLIGGSGFVVIMIGILLTSIGLWRTLSA